MTSCSSKYFKGRIYRHGKMHHFVVCDWRG